MQVVAVGERRSHELVRAGGSGWRHDYIGSPGLIDTNPQAFLVDRLYPEARIDPHFHDVDQFQIVVEGYCRMGKKPAAPVTYQYADAYTPYGPIVGNEQGFAFFTLRPIASGGFFAMPGNRHNMPCRAGRNLAGRFECGQSLGAGEVLREDLMAPQADGVAAVGWHLGARASTDALPSTGGGQYYLVCAGEISWEGKRLAEGSLAHVQPGEAAPALNAGANGASVLVLQFARPTERPGSDPAELARRDPDAYMQRPEGSGR